MQWQSREKVKSNEGMRKLVRRGTEQRRQVGGKRRKDKLGKMRPDRVSVLHCERRIND